MKIFAVEAGSFMPMIYNSLFPAMWLAYLGYWRVMSTNVKAAGQSEPMPSRLVRLVAMFCAAALLWLPGIPVPWLGERFLPTGAWCFWSGGAITATGLLFSLWARRRLGRNWSQAVTIKEDHELVTSGPYALVRHPIYSGLLLAFVGTALALGEWRGLLAVGLVFCVLLRKLRLEEKWMRRLFGASYETYSRRVAALVPYVI